MKDNTETLTQLGNQNTKYVYQEPTAELLETFENLYPGREYVTEFVFNEFTSLCLHGDTLIDVAIDETSSPEGIPIRDLVGKTGVVFSFDINENKPVARNFHSVRKTGNKPVLCIKFSLLKGASNARHWVEKQIVCSYEHPFLVRVGWSRYEWIAAQDLKPNMQLVADQRSGGVVRTSLETKDLRKEKELPALNHRIVSIEPIGNADVYNMEVEDTECFFANGVVVHNCPKTGQPDFATITVRYAPAKLCIETKSLKLYFLSYRQHGAFMESITNRMLEDCISVCKPRWMEVKSNFNTRGGTLINVEVRYNAAD